MTQIELRINDGPTVHIGIPDQPTPPPEDPLAPLTDDALQRIYDAAMAPPTERETLVADLYRLADLLDQHPEWECSHGLIHANRPPADGEAVYAALKEEFGEECARTTVDAKFDAVQFGGGQAFKALLPVDCGLS